MFLILKESVAMMTEKTIFPFLREKAPIVDRIREKTGRTNSNLVSSPSELATSFRKGLAEGLGLPLEALDIQGIQKWMVEFLKSFVTSEMMEKVAPNVGEITNLGRDLGNMLRSSFTVSPQVQSEEIAPLPKENKKVQRSNADASVISNE